MKFSGCSTNGSCSAVEDAAGDLTPECAMVPTGPGGGMNGRCTLDCSDNEDGCPTGMSCLRMGPTTMRCGYE